MISLSIRRVRPPRSLPLNRLTSNSLEPCETCRCSIFHTKRFYSRAFFASAGKSATACPGDNTLNNEDIPPSNDSQDTANQLTELLQHTSQPQPRDDRTNHDWNEMILQAVGDNRISKAIQLVRNMEKMGRKPDKITYTMIINAYVKQSDMVRAEKWLKRMIWKGIKPDVYHYTSMIDGYMQTSNVDRAEVMFRTMARRGITPSLVTYNVLMHQSVRQLDIATATSFWGRLLDAGLSPDVYTFAILMHGMGDVGRLDEAWRLFEMMQKKKIPINTVVATTLMDMHVNEKDNTYAIHLFKEFFGSGKGLQANKITDNVLLNAVISGAKIESIERFYRIYINSLQDSNPNPQENTASGTDETMGKILKTGPSAYTFTSFMRAFLRRNALRKVTGVYYDMQKHGVRPTIVTYGVLMLSYAYIPDPEACEKILNELKRAGFPMNTALYTIIMRAWNKAGNRDKVLETYNEMLSNKLHPNKYTMSILRRQTIDKNLLQMIESLDCEEEEELEQ